MSVSEAPRLDETRLWAESGAMWLTGRADGPPRVGPGRPASFVVDGLERFCTASAHRTGSRPTLPDHRLLGERAAVLGLRRQGPRSCGGAFRTVRTDDGWLGLSLARPGDLDLVPALVEREDVTDAWAAVADWAAGRTGAQAQERLELLGLPGSALAPARPRTEPRPGVLRSPGGRRAHVPERPLVIDFTSLWAGPLAAHLLHASGADVVKVETTDRPDGARSGPAEFFDLVHAGHRAVAIDPRDERDLDALRALVARADLVLEASRPRALARWGLDAGAIVADGTSWLSITAGGRASDRVGFGDDVAAGAGLVVVDEDAVLPCADALADPLTGVAAAAAAAEALIGDSAVLLDVSMHDVCRSVTTAPEAAPENRARRTPDGAWVVATADGEVEVARPTARRASGRAPMLGADTGRLLR